MRIVGAIALLVTGGCGDNTHLPVGIHDGARLVARYYAADDASVFRFWHDTQLDLDCSFQIAADGRYRCLPNDYASGYADPSCTRPNVTVLPCLLAPGFVTGQPHALTSCPIDKGVGVYAVGAETTAYYTDSGGACLFYADNSGVVLHTSSEAALDDFVAAALVRDPTGGLVDNYAFHADDGAIENTSTWDTVRGAECSIYGDNPRCRPTETAVHIDNLWVDASCTGTHAVVDFDRVRPCAHATAALEYGPSHEETFRELGDAIPVVYSGAAGACGGETPDPSVVVYREGAPIADSQFPIASRILDGTGRVRALRYQVSDGPLAIATTLYDTVFDEPCTPQPWIDGSVRCAPKSAATNDGIYADSMCTQPIARTPAASLRVILVPHADESCGGVTRYEAFAVGAPYDGALYRTPDCQPFAREPSTIYSSVGASVELGELDKR